MFLGAAGATVAAIPSGWMNGAIYAAAMEGPGSKDSASPMDFGAVGDGATDDRRAVMAAFGYALDKRIPIDGGERTYGVRGTATISNQARPHIRQLRLKQLAPTRGRFLLGITDCSEIRIDALDLHVGSTPSAGDMDDTGGLQVLRGSGHNIRNVTATGQGRVTYVRFWGSRDSLFENIVVHDGLFQVDPATDHDATDRRLIAADDRVQAIHLADCYRCTLVSPIVRNLHGNATYYTQSGYNAERLAERQVVAFPNMRTRGICGGGNVDLTVVNPIVYDVEQAIDFSGDGNNWGNRGVQIKGGELVNCGSVGVKFANGPNGCVADGVKVRNVGMYGFLMTGQTTSHQGVDSSFIDCECLNPGYNDIQFDTDAEGAGVPAYSGFYLASLPGINDGGLIGGLVKNCRATDKQGFYLAGDDSPWALAGATSATMAEPWTGYTGAYRNAVFTTSAGSEIRAVTLTNGSTAVSWSGGLTGNVTHPFVKRPAAMQYGALCEAPYVPGSLKPNLCEGLLSVGHVKAAQKGFQRYSCSLKGSSLQRVPTDANTAVLWDSEVDDTMGMHSQARNRSRIVCPTSGMYRVEGALRFSPSAAGGYRRAQVSLDGVAQSSFAYDHVEGEETIVPFKADLLAATGQYVEILASQNSGRDVELDRSASHITVALVRSA